jgi:hypothetical protein
MVTVITDPQDFTSEAARVLLEQLSLPVQRADEVLQQGRVLLDAHRGLRPAGRPR